jgi:hypothetical protein
MGGKGSGSGEPLLSVAVSLGTPQLGARVQSSRWHVNPWRKESGVDGGAEGCWLPRRLAQLCVHTCVLAGRGCTQDVTLWWGSGAVWLYDGAAQPSLRVLT